MAAGCLRPQAADPEKPAEASRVSVQTVAVESVDLRRTSTQPATVHPFYEVDLRAKVSGYVREVLADIGDVVEAGTTLAVIDMPELLQQGAVIDARVARLEAEQLGAQADVDLAQANISSAEALLAESRSQLAEAEALLAASEAEFRRVTDLVSRQAIEPRLLDEVRKKRDGDLARRNSVYASIKSAEAQVTVAQARRKVAEAAVQVAQADTRVAQQERKEIDVSLRYATITAPFSGVVTGRHVNPGDLVATGNPATRLFRISQVDKVRIHVPVPERDAPLVNVGDAVSLTFPSFAAEELTANVTRSTQSIEHNTRTMLVEAVVENTDGRLLPGMFGQASIELSTMVEADVLPARVIRFDAKGQPFVYVVGVDDAITVTPVETGWDDGSSIQILGGLPPGQRVVDAHLQRFVDGQPVLVLPR